MYSKFCEGSALHYAPHAYLSVLACGRGLVDTSPFMWNYYNMKSQFYSQHIITYILKSFTMQQNVCMWIWIYPLPLYSTTKKLNPPQILIYSLSFFFPYIRGNSFPRFPTRWMLTCLHACWLSIIISIHSHSPLLYITIAEPHYFLHPHEHRSKQ